jgi:EmrB/QacA subfamily drug resistance transporter
MVEMTDRGGSARWWALAAITVSGLVVGLDMTILITALPTLATRLGAGTSELQWFSDAYTLTLGGLLLPAGVLGDRLGRRRLLLIGLALFGVSSVVAAQMTSSSSLIAMRALMGVGAAIILPLSLSILPTLFSEAERPRAVALAAVGAFLGLPLGPLAAGWLLTHFAWGSIFLINAPVVAVALVGIWLLVPESSDPQAPPLDWIGAILAIAGVTALVYSIVEEPGRGWGDPVVLGSLVTGTVALAAFAAWDLRVRAPLVDLHLFLNGRFAWSTAAFAVAAFALAGGLFVLTPYLQIVQGNNAQGTGIKLLPLIAAVMIGGLASDRVTARAGTKLVVSAGLLVTAAGLLLLSRAGADTGYGLVAAGLTVTGLGMGLSMPTALDAVLGSLPSEQTGAGTALSRTVQQTGASFGVAILGSILNNAYRASLLRRLPSVPTQVREASLSNVAAAVRVAQHLPGRAGGRLVQAAFVSYAHGMSTVLVVCAGLMLGGALLMLLFLPARAPSPAEPEMQPVPAVPAAP